MRINTLNVPLYVICFAKNLTFLALILESHANLLSIQINNYVFFTNSDHWCILGKELMKKLYTFKLVFYLDWELKMFVSFVMNVMLRIGNVSPVLYFKRQNWISFFQIHPHFMFRISNWKAWAHLLTNYMLLISI